MRSILGERKQQVLVEIAVREFTDRKRTAGRSDSRAHFLHGTLRIG